MKGHATFAVVLLLVVLCLFVDCPAAPPAPAAGKVQILILNSYHSEYLWTRDQVEGFSEVLRLRYPDANLYTEFLDAKRVDRTNFQRTFAKMLAEKYRGIRFSLVYTTDDIALEFAQSYSEKVWDHNTPIVASGINSSPLIDRDLHPLTFGVFEDEPGREVISEALRQNPGARQIVVIADATEVGHEIGDQIENDARELSNLPIIRTPFVPWKDLQDFIARYDADTLFLLALYAVDSDGHYLDPTHVSETIAAHARGPVYIFTEMYAKSPDIVGGLVNCGHDHGQTAGNLAVAILEHRDPAQIDTLKHTYQKWVFNHDALERFGYDRSALPEGSEILNEPKNFIREHAKLFLFLFLGISLQTVLIVGLLLNISRRRALTKALMEREAQLSKLIENSPVAISICDEAGRTVLINRRYRQMAGYSLAEIPTFRRLQELAFPDPVYRAEIGQLMEEARLRATTSEAPVPIPYRALTKYGTWVELESYFATAGGLSFRIILDVTQRNMTHRQLKAAGEAARAASEAKSRFLANMSHEVRTPLNGILGMVQLLRDTAITEEQKDCLDTIRESGDLLLTVINDILDISKIEAGQMSLTLETVKFSEFLRGVASIAGPTIEERGLLFLCTVAPGVPDTLRCDPSRLKQVLLNLLVNASKFTDKGSVEFLVHGSGSPGQRGSIRFSIVDTGIGIPEDQQERIFEPFVQADTSHTRKRGGTGLGLTISRKIVNLMGGEIHLESSPGRGSTFSFEIPVDVLEPMAPRLTNNDHIALGLAAELPMDILVAEDNMVNQKVVGMMLLKMGYKADFASNGSEAVDASLQKHYDLILMDVQMPVMDGLQATRRIRELLPTLAQPQIFALTAHALGEDCLRCTEAGMNGHLTKPVKAAMLKRTVEEAFRSVHRLA